jgi:DNA-binding NarL/FixJ family response regulator
MLIDDHALFRTSLRMVLSADATVGEIIEAGSLVEALAYKAAQVDLVLLDIQLPGLNGLEGITVLKSRLAKTPIIMLSAQADAATIHHAKLRGAAGFVSKAATAEQVFYTIAKVLAGEIWFSSDFPSDAAPEDAIPKRLTARQLEVLGQLCRGLSNKLIARELGMTENTVRVHVAAILAYLNVANRSQAILTAQRLGMVR